MDVTYQELSDLTGKHKNTIINRLTASTLTCEDLGPGKAKLWDSAEALQVIYEAEFKRNGGPAAGALDLNAERARAEKERADKLELENAKRRGELLEAADLAREFETLLVNFKTKITGIPSKVSALVDDIDERRRVFIEAKAITDQALTDLGRGLDQCIE